MTKGSTYTTKTGRVLTEADLDAFVAEAEAGYDVEELARRPGRRARVKYFLDEEFIEDGRTIDLVSIALVCEDGRELSIEFANVDWSKASDWVLENVRPHLTGQSHWETRSGVQRRGLLSRDEAKDAILRFIGGVRPEFWADHADYDWVGLCQLYGPMVALPQGWPKLCLDVRQLALMLGDPELPPQDGIKHVALPDARWTRSSHDWLVTMAADRMRARGDN